MLMILGCDTMREKLLLLILSLYCNLEVKAWGEWWTFQSYLSWFLENDSDH